jgi:hypothetical protein
MSKKMDDSAGKPTLFEQPAIQERENREKEEKRKNMNTFQKLNELRAEVLKSPIKKSGFNKFQNYEYFELKDFMPVVINKMKELGLCAYDRMVEDMFVLTMVNAEDPTDERIDFSIPWSMSTTTNNPVQNEGSSITYFRRYVWSMALELIETEVIDAQDQKVQPKIAKASKEQIEAIQELYSPAQIASMLSKRGYKTISDFSMQDAEQAINFRKEAK